MQKYFWISEWVDMFIESLREVVDVESIKIYRTVYKERAVIDIQATPKHVIAVWIMQGSDSDWEKRISLNQSSFFSHVTVPGTIFPESCFNAYICSYLKYQIMALKQVSAADKYEGWLSLPIFGIDKIGPDDQYDDLDRSSPTIVPLHIEIPVSLRAYGDMDIFFARKSKSGSVEIDCLQFTYLQSEPGESQFRCIWPSHSHFLKKHLQPQIIDLLNSVYQSPLHNSDPA